MRQLIEIFETDIDLFVSRPGWASEGFLEKVLGIPLPSWPNSSEREMWGSSPAEADGYYGAKDKYFWFVERFYLEAGWKLKDIGRVESGKRAWALTKD